MKRRSAYISAICLLAAIAVAAPAHLAHAQAGAIASLFNLDLGGFVLSIIANTTYYAFSITSYLLVVTGTLLNASINITLHIKQLLAAVPAVYITWGVIRDMSSVVFIFALLWAAILMILNIEKQNFGSFIKNIIIAGVLINFSFFFVGLLIDASNIVSLQFYRAIAPGKEFVGNNPNSWKGLVSSAFNDGGVSDVFMQALQIQSFSQNKGQLGSHDVSLQIIISSIGGIIITIFAAMSFLAATLAFIIRTGMLILLLAFSPLWMAGRVIPEIKKELADPWWKYLYSNLVFMPVYLLFMYIAMRIMLGDNPPATGIANLLGAAGATGNQSAAAGSQGVLGTQYFGMVLNYVLAIMFINAPLIAAVKIGGDTMKWSTGLRGVLLQKTVGWASLRAQQSKAMQGFLAKYPRIGMDVNRGLGKLSGGDFGAKGFLGQKSYRDTAKKTEKEIEDTHKSIEDKALQARFRANVKNTPGTRPLGKLLSKIPVVGGVIGPAVQKTANSVLGVMMKNRDATKKAEDLQKKADKVTSAKELKTTRAELKNTRSEHNEAVAELEKHTQQLEKEARGIGMAPIRPPSADDSKKKVDLEKKIADTKVKMAELEKKEGEQAEAAQELAKEEIINEAVEKAKIETGGSEGGGSKKPDEGGEKKKE